MRGAFTFAHSPQLPMRDDAVAEWIGGVCRNTHLGRNALYYATSTTLHLDKGAYNKQRSLRKIKPEQDQCCH